MNQQVKVCPKCGFCVPENSPYCSKCSFVFMSDQFPAQNITPANPVQSINNNASLHRNSQTGSMSFLFSLVISVLTFILIVAIYKLPVASLSDNHTSASSNSRDKSFSTEIATLYFGEKTELHDNIYYISSSGSRESVKSDIVGRYRDSIEGAESPLTLSLIIVMMLAIFTSVFAVTKHSFLSLIFAALNTVSVFFMLIPPEMPFCKSGSYETYNFSLIPDVGGIFIIILVFVIAGFAVTNFFVKMLMKHIRHS